MIALLANFIDWYGLQIWWAVRLRSVPAWVANSKQEKSLQFLNSPNFLPAASEAAQLLFDGSVHFRFPTPRPTNFVENNTVYGRLYRCVGRWQERPAIILLHGGGGGDPDYHFRFPFVARRCNRAGFNAVRIAAPYHFQRRALGRAAWTYLQIAEAFAQSVAEIRALTGWLLEQGCPAVALWGDSLGGWVAGLAALHDTRLAAVVLTVPGVRPNYKFANSENVIWKRVREALKTQKTAYETLDKTPLNLTLSQPVIPKENILLIQGRYDLFLGTEQIEELWQKWKQPNIWRLSHGHVSWMFTPGVTGRILRWLKPRLDGSGCRNDER